MGRFKKSAAVHPRQKRVLYLSTAGLWLSGAIWLYLPLPWLLKVHGAVAFAFLMVFGTMLFEHVPAGWPQTAHRPTGLFLLAACAVLILTGWGLYYIGSDVLRLGVHWVHSVVGVLLPLLIFVHVRLAQQKIKKLAV